VKVVVDYDRCASNAVCMSLLPQIFEVRDDGYLYVLDEHRGRGLGVELVREIVENGPYAGRRWVLHTRDMHALYRKLGFGPNERLMERTP